MKILNLYAGIGGNRKLWEGHEVTAVEYEPYIAEEYARQFPEDTVVVGDAHQYLLDHYEEFDFIWASPPCPTHSRLNHSYKNDWKKHLLKYPDMSLYQEIIFLREFYKGKWVVENVEPYYPTLINPRVMLDRHLFWSNFSIPKDSFARLYEGQMAAATIQELSDAFGLPIPPQNARKLLRNAVDPRLGEHILKAALKKTEQGVLL